MADGIRPEDVRIQQEVYLGRLGAFADIKVTVPGSAPYFVEVKYGYPPEKVVRHLERKFGAATPGGREAAKLVLVIDAASSGDWPATEREIRRSIRTELALEIWDESMLLSLIRSQFGLSIDRLSEIAPPDLHAAIDRAKGVEAFADSFVNDPLQGALLWHFGSWILRQVREESGARAREVLPPGLYKNVVAVFADLSSFSSYVRDTRNDQVVRHVLTFFYSKSRYQVLNSGGMLYQFLGDGVVALFGVIGRRSSCAEDALECATALLDIGRSTSNEWQRRIDHVQTGGGCHIGMAIGDLNIVSLRPFSRSHVAQSQTRLTRRRACARPLGLTRSSLAMRYSTICLVSRKPVLQR